MMNDNIEIPVKIPKSFFKSISPDRLRQFLLANGYAKEREFYDEAGKPESYVNNKTGSGFLICTDAACNGYGNSVYIVLTFLTKYIGKDLFSIISEDFGWGRCRTCRFFKKDEWSDDVGWIGFCKSPADFTEEALFGHFGCVHYEWEGNL